MSKQKTPYQLYIRLPKAIYENRAESGGGLNKDDMYLVIEIFTEASKVAVPDISVYKLWKRSDLVKLINNMGLIDNVELKLKYAQPDGVGKQVPTSTGSTIAIKPPASRPPASRPPASRPPASRPSASRPPASRPPASRPATKTSSVPLCGSGTAQSANLKILEQFNRVTSIASDPTSINFDNVMVEHGGAGDCGYHCFVAGLNQIMKLKGLPESHTMKGMRAIVAESIKSMSTDSMSALYTQTYDKSVPTDHTAARTKLVNDTMKPGGRWATEYDFNILSEYFGVGLFIFSSRDGKLYTTAANYNGYTYYMSIINLGVSANKGGNHYQTVAFRPQGSSATYCYAYPHHGVPAPIILLINEMARDGDTEIWF